MFIPTAIEQTFPEHWPAPLKALAAPTKEIALSLDDTWALGLQSSWFRRATGNSGTARFSDAFLADIEAACEAWPEGVSPRIGLCSWKDCSPSDLPSFGMRGVLHTICGDSERVGRALAAHVGVKKPAVLHLRQWRDIPRESEFRVFFRDGQVIGVSQYFWRLTFPRLVDDHRSIAAQLVDFLPRVAAALPMPDCAVDLCLDPAEPFVIEVNPLVRATDPCLFSWNDPASFDATLRIRDGNRTLRIAPSP